jgi:hypothetical protein
MKASTVYRMCPHCASDRLIFLEHGSGVTVFQCEACRRPTMHRWTPAAAETLRHRESFEFPNWFTGTVASVKVTNF